MEGDSCSKDSELHIPMGSEVPTLVNDDNNNNINK